MLLRLLLIKKTTKLCSDLANLLKIFLRIESSIGSVIWYCHPKRIHIFILRFMEDRSCFFKSKKFLINQQRFVFYHQINWIAFRFNQPIIGYIFKTEERSKWQDGITSFKQVLSLLASFVLYGSEILFSFVLDTRNLIYMRWMSTW